MRSTNLVMVSLAILLGVLFNGYKSQKDKQDDNQVLQSNRPLRR